MLVYPLGVAAPAAAALHLLLSGWRLGLRVALRRIAQATAPAVIAIGLLFLDFQVEVGRWNAHLLVQDK